MSRISSYMLETKTRQFWRLSRAWMGQSEEFIPLTVLMDSLVLILRTTKRPRHMLHRQALNMYSQVVWQSKATEKQLEDLP